MTAGNDIIHQQHRLRIMAALESDSEPLDFASLKTISGATDGNLGAHLKALESAGYVDVTKEVVGKRTRTWIRATPTGKRALREHAAYLRSILDRSSNDTKVGGGS